MDMDGHSGHPRAPCRSEGAVQDVVREALPLDTIVIAIPDPSYKPLEHRGDLRRVPPPEEIAAAYLFAIKRDIGNHESDEVLLQWRDHMLSTTCKLVLLHQWPPLRLPWNYASASPPSSHTWPCALL